MSGTFRKAVYAVPVDPSAVRADFPAFSFDLFVDPPGQVWAGFVHATDEFVVVAEGEIDINVAGESARCRPGDLVLIPAGASHSLSTTHEAGSRWYYGYGRFGGADG
jgi:quercetin dioxygenase-like cupin family protein